MQTRHQTTRLKRGAHREPEDGMCVMELASVLAEEEFSDAPDCVDPTIAAYLRALNDRIPIRQRQRLGPYARRVLGTRGGRRLEQARQNLCLEFAGIRVFGRSRASKFGARLAARGKVAAFAGPLAAPDLSEGAGELAARSAVAEDAVEEGFGLLEALIAEGEPGEAPRSPGAPEPGCNPPEAEDPRPGREARDRSAAIAG